MTQIQEFRETIIWFLSDALRDYDEHDKFINTFIRIIDSNILSKHYVASIVNNLMPVAMKNDDIIIQLEDFIDEVIEQGEIEELYEVCKNLMTLKEEVNIFFEEYNAYLKNDSKKYDRSKNKLVDL